jgi:hypothetical protein
MYTKTGLGALAIAGLTLGAVGMLTSAGASPTDCRTPSSGVSAPATGDNGSTSVSAPDSSDKNANKDAGKNATKKKDGDKNGTNPGTTPPNQGPNGSGGSAGSNGSNGSADNGDGSGSGNDNLLTIDGGTNAPADSDVNVTVPGRGTAPNAGSTSGGTSSADDTFLDLQGRTKTVQTPAGTVPVPPTDAGLIGRSWYIRSLLQITGRANAGS